LNDILKTHFNNPHAVNKSNLFIQNTKIIYPEWIIIIGSVFIIPFIYSTSTIDPVSDLRFFIFSFLILVLFSYFLFQHFIKPQSLSILNRKIFILILSYFIINILSLLSALNIYEGIREVLKTGLFISFLFASIILLKTQLSREYLSKSVVISSIALSLIGLAQYYFNLQSIPGGWGFPYSTMANGNLLSSALFLMTPFIIYGAFVFTNYWRISSNIALSLSIFIMAIVQTRSVWLAFSLSLLLIILIAIVFQKKSKIVITNNNPLTKRVKKLIPFVFVSILLAVVSNSYLNPERSLTNRLVSIANLDDPSVNERIFLWQKTIEMSLDNPILGVGPGNWKIAFPEYGTDGLRAEDGFTNFQRPHNDYLWILSETGIFGLICYVLIFFFIYYYGIKSFIHLNDRSEKIYIICLLFGITGYLIISFFSFPKERITHIIFLGLIFSNIISIYHASFPLKKIPSSSGNLFVIIPILLLGSVSCYGGYQRFSSDQSMRKVLIYRQQNEWGKLIEEVKNIDKYFYSIDNSVIPVIWYRGIANYSLNNKKQAFDDFGKAVKLHPNNVHALNNFATILEEFGHHDKAISQYQKAVAISPKFEEALLNLSAVFYNSGKYKLASETILQISGTYNTLKVQQFQKKINSKLKEGKENETIN
jgi:O-antigen ligase